MRSNRRLSAGLLGSLVLTTALASATLAQETSGDALPPTCVVLTAEEVSAALGEPLTLVDGPDADCQFDTDYESGRFLSLFSDLDSGDLAQIKEFVGEGTDVTVGTVPGLYLPDTMGTLLYVAPAPDTLFSLQLVGSPIEGLDTQQALSDLIALAIPRIAGVPLPTGEPIPAGPSFTRDADLEALFPAQVGGMPVTIQSMSGSDFAAGGEVPPGLQAALDAAGKTLADVRIGIGYVQDVNAGTALSISAFQVKGTDMPSFKAALLPILFEGQTVGGETPAQVGGKDVTTVDIEGRLTYLYPRNDILWVVTGVEPTLTEVFTVLP